MALNLLVKVHPVVLFQIVDSYERRGAEAHRVIGTLLGTVEKGVVEVTNCFCVPHKEYEDQVDAELNYALDLYELNRLVNAQESIVGWWATGNEVTNHSSVIHEYYARECNNPIHLTVDTTLEGTTRMGIKAYICVKLGVPNGKTGCMFTPAKVQIQSYNPEVVGLQLCSKTLNQNKSNSVVEPIMDLAQIAEASTKLSSMLDSVLQYVDDVLSGKQPPDNHVGRALLDMVNSVPKMTPDQFDNMFNSNVKDLLMVVALSQLIKTQLQLNEKLTLLTDINKKDN
ncbi:eukaryotic translation initiation factor 3 subunit F [Copidosoma floridanum]|uniref:eukaryotic translation initiation factor 3 subunit F n=1 Tax=Copidosoma floridanum TaxID=29053 RepID=UPI0006C987A5|nr:eukaryotic translation initiation factor 3 subunit F [Copidosoma floridanum]